MTEWEPATDAEVAMRDALRTDDQESYFRIVAGLDLLLPVTAEALAGLTPLGWGTWSTGGRTHVLAFTSPSAMQACLADYSGSARRITYADLAGTWPNLEWWLAVNPGLPIEGYLPAWFVAQLARGDLRLPPRAPSGDGPADPSPAQPAEAGLPARTPGVVAPAGAARRVPAPAAAAQTADTPADPASPITPPVAYPPAAAAPVSAPPVAYPQPQPVPSGASGSAVAPTPGGPLPRRPLTPPSERPPSMAAAAQALVGVRAPQAVPEQSATQAAATPATAPQAAAPQAAAPQAAAPQAAAPQAAAPETAAVRATTPHVFVPNTSASQASAGLAPPVVPGMLVGPSPSGAVPLLPARPVPPMTRATAGDGPPSGGSFRRDETAPSGPAARSNGRYDDDEEFRPANEVEHDLYAATAGGSTDVFLSTLLLATVLVPVGERSRPGAQPGDAGFEFRTEDNDGDRYLAVFTSPDRLEDHYPEPVRTIGVRFHHLINHWPDRAWAFAVNPGSPVGAKLPGEQIVALASWATAAGLGADDTTPGATVSAPLAPPAPRGTRSGGAPATIMQKTLPPEQVDYFLERGYDRVSGFVHRVDEVAHLRTPADLRGALGLGYAGSSFQADAKEAYVLRWAAYRPSLYRIPYGGQTEQALRAMEGWVIERAPFRGNGFAPGESRDVIAEFKVDSARLPHGTQLWRLDAGGDQQMIAVLDCDALSWRRVGEQ